MGISRAGIAARPAAESPAGAAPLPPAQASAKGGGAGGILRSVAPNSRAPGAAQLTTLVSDLLLYVLVACGVGALAGLAAWAATTHSGHYAMAGRSKMGFLAALAG